MIQVVLEHRQKVRTRGSTFGVLRRECIFYWTASHDFKICFGRYCKLIGVTQYGIGQMSRIYGLFVDVMMNVKMLSSNIWNELHTSDFQNCIIRRCIIVVAYKLAALVGKLELRKIQQSVWRLTGASYCSNNKMGNRGRHADVSRPTCNNSNVMSIRRQCKKFCGVRHPRHVSEGVNTSICRQQ